MSPSQRNWRIQERSIPRDMQPDEIVLSFRDPAAIEALHVFGDLTDDDDLAVAIVKRLDAIAEEYRQMMRWLG